MISNKEFVDWLRGFVAGSSKHNLSTEGWDTIRKRLEEVYDDGLLELLKNAGTFTAPTFPSYPGYPVTPLPSYPYSEPYVGDAPGWWHCSPTCNAAADQGASNTHFNYTSK